MNNSYYLHNNPVMVMGVIEAALKHDRRVDAGRIAVLLPILFDEKLVGQLLDDRIQYTFRQLIQQNNMYIANYNDRYISLLSPFYQALTIMLDADVVVLNGANIEAVQNKPFSIVDNSKSLRMKRVSSAVERLLTLSEKENNKELYQLLKVEI